MSRHQWVKEFMTHPKVYPFWLTFYLFYWFYIWNTLVSSFTNGHFQPTPFLFTSNAPSLTPLIHCSLSFSLYSAYSHLCFHLLPFDINAPTISYALSLTDLIDQTWCFTQGITHNNRMNDKLVTPNVNKQVTSFRGQACRVKWCRAEGCW